MELTQEPLNEQAVSEATPPEEHSSVLRHPPEKERSSDGQGTETAEKEKVVELKLDIYVPAPLIIEPITPEEETVELFQTPLVTQEVNTQTEAHTERKDELGSAENCHRESQADSSSDPVADVECEPASKEADSSETKNAAPGSEATVCSSKTQQLLPITTSSGKKLYSLERKAIPPKKNKFDPLKINMDSFIPITSSEITLQCLECHIIFRDSKSKKRHFSKSHPKSVEYQRMLGDVTYFCYVCDQSFSSSTELMAHQSTHTEGERFKCLYCDEAFKRSCELTDHKKKVHYSQPSHSCTQCGKTYKTISLLRYHQRAHSGEKPFVCSFEDCGKKFASSKSLYNHIQHHQNLDPNENASTTAKNKKSKGIKKYPCSQCRSVFKTSASFHLHVKNKHSQGPKPAGLTLTPAVNGHAQTLLIEPIRPVTQSLTMNKLNAEHIKELIEKLGNVQKVNQLVILPLQPSSFGLPLPPPLHVNFTQPSTCVTTDANSSKVEQVNHKSSAEIESLQPKEIIVLPDKFVKGNPKDVQDQIDEFVLDLVPIQTEPSDLLKQSHFQVDASQECCEQKLARTTEEQIIDGALETVYEPPLNPQPETESVAALKTTNEPHPVPNIEIAENCLAKECSVPNTAIELKGDGTEDVGFPTQIQESANLIEQVAEPDTVKKITDPQELKIQNKRNKAGSEPQPSKLERPFQCLNRILEEVPVINQEASVVKPKQAKTGQHQSLFVKKKVTKKKKQTKEQVANEETKEASEVIGSKAASSKKVKDSSNVSSKKQEKNKNKKLVVKFGSNKKRTSKPKAIKTSKTKPKPNQQSSEDHQFLPAFQEHTLDSNKNDKIKVVERLSGASVKSLGQHNTLVCSVLTTPVQTLEKTQKRKMKSLNKLTKKTKSVYEAQEDENKGPVPKKKKPAKASEDHVPKKLKVKKTHHDDQKKKAQNLPMHNVTHGDPDQAHIEKQALLLLKGHKQPQLKVHKLDASELEKSPSKKNAEKQQKRKNGQKKSVNVAKKSKKKSDENTLLDYNGEPLSFEMSLITSPAGSVPTKSKVARKRKAPIKLDQEIALSPPYSQLTLGCQDCGKTFSEVSALQLHMASWHSAGKFVISDDIYVAKQRITESSPPDKPHLHNVFEIQVGSDWDMETEVGEIVGERLSFPTLCQSPSLLPGSSGAEAKEQGSNVERLDMAPEKDLSVPVFDGSAMDQETLSKKEDGNDVSKITKTPCPDLKDSLDEEIKEELPSGVSLVIVGDQNEEDKHNDLGVSQECNRSSQSEEPAKDGVSTKNMIMDLEIKQEEEEILVPSVDDHNDITGGHTVMKGKKGTATAGGKKPAGQRSSTDKKHKKFHIAGSPARKKEMHKNDSESDRLLPLEGTPEEQVIFELDSVTTSVMDIVTSGEGSLETSSELGRGNSPGIILEKFLTARERNIETPIIQFPLRQVANAYAPSEKVKVEENVPTLAHQFSSEGRLGRGKELTLVKVENHSSPTELFQAFQPTDPPRVPSQRQASDMVKDGFHVMPVMSYSKQHIFYPVKEEERELTLENTHAAPMSLASGETAGPTSGAEYCEEVRVRSVQMDTQNLFTNTEEGDEQQRTRGFLEFLSDSSDTEETDILHTEPEMETLVLSCYRGIQRCVSTHQSEERQDCGGSVSVHDSPGTQNQPWRELRKPIDYFSQYFSRDTWSEIAAATNAASNLTISVTEKEVASFVGIHIAMGTLKFPTSMLYWEDNTRVPLIADAMLATRFSELARKMKLVSPARSSMDTRNNQSPEASTGDCPGLEQTCPNANTNPLWRVMPVIKRVQDGCQALARSGSYAVDQYPLTFQRHPTQSLLHTVLISTGGLVLDFNLGVDDSNKESVVETMVCRGENNSIAFLCKPELSTPSMVERLLEAGVQSAGKVGGSRCQIGDEFLSSDGKLKLFRCYHGFILSAVTKEKSRSTSLVSGFERAIKAANLNRDLRSLYPTPCTNSAVSAWPQSVLWDLIDLVLVNAWIEYKQDYHEVTDLLSHMAFRLDIAKALIHSSVDAEAQDSSPPCPPAPKVHSLDVSTRASPVLEASLPEEETRYDGFGHWPEQVTEGEEAQRCRFGGCERTSRVRCLKCCVFLCISRNHNCFLKFHSQGSS